MKCFVINSEKKEIEVVNINDVTELFNIFEGEITSFEIDDQNVVIVEDGETAIEELPYGFHFEGDYLNGNGIVIGFNNNDGYCDTSFDIQVINDMISF